MARNSVTVAPATASNGSADVKTIRCAIYARKSSGEGLAQEFNSLDAQRESAEAYIKSQAHEGWRLIPDPYDDGGSSGASLDRPALQGLLADVRAGKINILVVYKVDRLTRSLSDLAKIVGIFDAHNASFVSVTQQFHTTTSASDAQHAALVCPIRARDRRRAHPRQDRGVEEEGHVDGRQRAARL